MHNLSLRLLNLNLFLVGFVFLNSLLKFGFYTESF